MARRSVVISLAGVLGVGAGGTAYAAVHSAQQKALKDTALTSAYVITGQVPRGESAQQALHDGLLHKSQIPLQFRPSSAVTDLAAINGKNAAFPLPAGEILVDGMFVSPSDVASPAAQTVPAGDVAISVSVDQMHGVAGLIQPGDKVDILANINGAETYLYRAVPVLAVNTTLLPTQGQNTTSSSGTNTPTGPAGSSAGTNNTVITFAVSPEAAVRIAQAESGSTSTGSNGVYLTLEAPNAPSSAATNLASDNAPAGE